MNSLRKTTACITSVLILVAFMVSACSERPGAPVRESSVTKHASKKTEPVPVPGKIAKRSSSLKAVLLPETPTSIDILTLEIKTRRGEIIPPADVSWYVNENYVEGDGMNLDLSPYMPGDSVYAEAHFEDASLEPITTGMVIVANAPPEVIRAEGETVTASGRHIFRVKADATDPDHDRVTLLYRFYVNGTLFSEDGEGALDISNLKRGDRFFCEIVARDERGGESEKSTPKYTVANRPPRIVSRPPKSITGEVFTYKIASQDPDGDELVYELVEGPKGMVLLKDTLHWDVRSADTSVPIKAVVKASDGNGGDATQEFSLSVSSK